MRLSARNQAVGESFFLYLLFSTFHFVAIKVARGLRRQRKVCFLYDFVLFTSLTFLVQLWLRGGSDAGCRQDQVALVNLSSSWQPREPRHGPAIQLSERSPAQGQLHNLATLLFSLF